MQNSMLAIAHRGSNMLKLTGRQRQYLRQMIALQGLNENEPIHYSALAERLGVNNVTAYDMLRSLETKGCVEARYDLPEVRSGRSTILFSVTTAGRKLGR